MNAHIINIPDETYFRTTCIPQGFLGVNIVVGSTNPQGLSYACKTSYSMYADMCTIRPGDIIFVHAGTKIYGAFKAESEFREDSAVPDFLKSANIHYRPKPNVPNSGWQNIFTGIGTVTNYRRISISHFDLNGRNVAYTLGIDSTDLFDLKYKGKIFSISEKWKYPDAARTVRPLMEYEAYEILNLLEVKNSDVTQRHTITPANLQMYLPVNFILNPNIVQDEKIIEGWICSQLGRNAAIDTIFNEFTCFGNNVPIAYLRHMDIVGYKQLFSGLRKYRIIETKKDDCVFPDDINQLIYYLNKTSENLVNNDFKLVEGYLVARSFSQDCMDFVNRFNETGRLIKLVSFQYDAPDYLSLTFTQVV